MKQDISLLLYWNGPKIVDLSSIVVRTPYPLVRIRHIDRPCYHSVPNYCRFQLIPIFWKNMCATDIGQFYEQLQVHLFKIRRMISSVYGCVLKDQGDYYQLATIIEILSK